MASGAAFAALTLIAGSMAGGLAALLWHLGTDASRRTVREETGQPDGQISKDVRNLVGLLDLPALLIDASGTVSSHNDGARLVFPQIRNGQPLYQVSRNPGLLDAVQRCRDDRATQTGEFTERVPAGRRLMVIVSPLLTPARAAPADAGGDAPAMLVQLRDLTEQDRLAQLRSDFIANASHELRTPLASLKGFVETLQGPASGDEKARTRFLGIMAAQAARMARILDDLLSLSRIEMRAHVPPVEAVDVSSIVRSALHGLEPIAQEAQITLSLSAPKDPELVRGDADELEQVFQNLIENAIKYGHKQGKVDIVIRREAIGAGRPDQITIAIADDGPGIAEEHLPRLTERFYRVDTATSRERGGTGLGLAIVKHILNRHSGQLEIESEAGEGSTFSVILNAIS
jgi:two-component system, OmpR family, phosphate regulon sensor histidine kinase PhoR